MGDTSALDIGASVGAWNAVIRRARLTRDQTAAALVVSSYADADGTAIHCGVATLAVDLGIGYSTARRYLAWMRTVGLIELVRHGNARRGLSDEYRLTLDPRLLDHIDLPDPDAYRALKDKIRDANRSGQAARRQRINQRPAIPSADGPVDNPSSALATVSADTPPATEDQRSPTPSAENPDQRSPGQPSALALGERPPSLTTSPKEHTSPKTPSGDQRTEVTDSRARASPCDHGLIRCPFCARGLAAA